MDPLDEMPVPRPAPSIPFALRVFIVFASSICAGAGFGLTLWALPAVAPQRIVETAVHDTQEALNTVLGSEPCTPPHTPGSPCATEGMSSDEKESDAHAGGTATEHQDTLDDTSVSAITDAGKIVLQTNKVLHVEQPVPVKKVDKKELPKPKEQKTVPQQQKTPEKKTVPQIQQVPAPVVVQPTTIAVQQPVVAQPLLQQVPQCTRNSSYLPASTLPLNPNGPAFQLTVEEAKYYTVFGRSALEIRRQMAQCSPIQGGFDAVTHWWYRYGYSYYEKENGLCGVKDVTLVLHITFLFPYWKSDTNDQQLTAHWNSYFSNLQTHEFGHRDITIQYAQSALSAIQAFPDAPCTNIVQSVNAYADAQLDVIQQKNTSYDMQTGHGETQGAVFP